MGILTPFFKMAHRLRALLYCVFLHEGEKWLEGQILAWLVPDLPKILLMRQSSIFHWILNYSISISFRLQNLIFQRARFKKNPNILEALKIREMGFPRISALISFTHTHSSDSKHEYPNFLGSIAKHFPKFWFYSKNLDVKVARFARYIQWDYFWQRWIQRPSTTVTVANSVS